VIQHFGNFPQIPEILVGGLIPSDSGNILENMGILGELTELFNPVPATVTMQLWVLSFFYIDTIGTFCVGKSLFIVIDQVIQGFNEVF
jgi:hypothetical protein